MALIFNKLKLQGKPKTAGSTSLKNAPQPAPAQPPPPESSDAVHSPPLEQVEQAAPQDPQQNPPPQQKWKPMPLRKPPVASPVPLQKQQGQQAPPQQKASPPVSGTPLPRQKASPPAPGTPPPQQKPQPAEPMPQTPPQKPPVPAQPPEENLQKTPAAGQMPPSVQQPQQPQGHQISQQKPPPSQQTISIKPPQPPTPPPSNMPTQDMAPAGSAQLLPPEEAELPDIGDISKSKTIQTEKTNVIKARGINMQDAIESYKEQLQNYSEVCDSINPEKTWGLTEIIDIVYVLVESLNLDVVAVALIDYAAGKTLVPIQSRGFKIPPPKSVASIWSASISDGPGISWNNLMMLAADTQSDLAKWIVKEGLDSIGYVPIHDCSTIYGFIFIGSHEKKTPSPLASSLLELLGSRLGLVLALRKFKGKWPLPK